MIHKFNKPDAKKGAKTGEKLPKQGQKCASKLWTKWFLQLECDTAKALLPSTAFMKCGNQMWCVGA